MRGRGDPERAAPRAGQARYHALDPPASRRQSASARWRRRPSLDCLLKWTLLAVVLVGLLLVALTIHGFHPVADPISALSILDQLSLTFGLHEQSAIAVADLELFSTTVFVYVFHRHISDGSFHVASEAKVQILPGIFRTETDSVLELRIQEVLQTILDRIPASCRADEAHTPIVLARIPPRILDQLGVAETERVAGKWTAVLTNSSRIHFDASSGLGTMSQNEARVLQWFAINLLDHGLQRYRVHQTALILEVGPTSVELTFALSSAQTSSPVGEIVATTQLSAFGHRVQLVTVRYPKLGLYEGRFAMLNLPASSPGADEPTLLRSACMNPISHTQWSHNGTEYQVVGKEQPDFELVKERNGPFAGKKINRPVANYGQCHTLAAEYISTHFPEEDSPFFKDMARGRKVYMEGLLLEKAMGRGLTLPYRGGHVRMKSFIDSLQHACKVPNTDQPFGCADLMYLATLLDKMLGFKQGSMLYSSCDIGGMTGEWPLAAAFHVYENGL
eukprot:maker-scaffold1125_size61249-snap-gene-0.10 protein:Tk00352 transcript:maker-scaffold1125_size61249-snap-gene-0.10-mRNA-1 annotation:"ectonucleoside triphosphate diphosphohydrolase 5-like"